MYITETTILQHLYWPGIRNTVQKEVTNYETVQRTKQSNKNMVKYQLKKMRKYHVTNSV